MSYLCLCLSINKNCQKLLEAIGRQYPFKPLKYLPKTLRLTIEEGIQMLKEAGVEVDPLGDLNTENERKLGELVKAKYDTKFYILHRYPAAIRPFYTMPCYDNSLYSKSFDVSIYIRIEPSPSIRPSFQNPNPRRVNKGNLPDRSSHLYLTRALKFGSFRRWLGATNRNAYQATDGYSH